MNGVNVWGWRAGEACFCRRTLKMYVVAEAASVAVERSLRIWRSQIDMSITRAYVQESRKDHVCVGDKCTCIIPRCASVHEF